ncbi:hypothetical protein [uncultured Aureimonas sp.]|uniref:hypothetical protein n=1 Tax=uncultured Aureimonas sp. TaxID=1604662 RepID=UPI0025E7627F|nr:hypothetical protein [uncultured Aureimonas sp.]
MTKKPEAEGSGQQKEAPRDKVCGIVMPISQMGELYSPEHWRRVQRILQKAIEAAGMRPKLVWENPEADVIHAAILQNIYDSDVVVCDLSGLNPNVMLEAGLRLSTKKPTVIVTDRVVPPPFDVSSIGYIVYSRDLEFNSIEEFIEKLSQKIKDVADAYDGGRYQSFVENFTVETVRPERIDVSAEKYFSDQIETIGRSIRRIERSLHASNTTTPRNPAPSFNPLLQESNSVRSCTVMFQANAAIAHAYHEHIYNTGMLMLPKLKPRNDDTFIITGGLLSAIDEQDMTGKILSVGYEFGATRISVTISTEN